MNTRPIRSKKAKTGGCAWRPVKGGITAPQGYLAAGLASGIKKAGLDMAVLFSSQPASGAAAFTQNLVQAAPVVLSRKHIEASRGQIRAILLNSGCANACTGEKGMQDALVSVRSLASLLGVEPNQVLAASTGVIGVPLPTRKVLQGISAAVSVLSSRGGDAAARAIMTTDTHEKSVAVECRINGKRVRIGGMAKGSGMIHPNLATMLAVVTTDAAISPRHLNRVFKNVLERTFHCLTVDGDTSTNDMVAVVANGASDVRIEGSLLSRFQEGLQRVCEELARKIARDGEGASKFVEIEVRGASTFGDARRMAKAIARSSLVKTALFGQELNWGRILCAAGYSGVFFNPESVNLAICGIPVFRRGVAVASTRVRAERALKSDEIRIRLDIAQGDESARVWTCDLTREYVNINASYIS